ncbi:hypothetical protein C1886_13875 [Pseudomonas sp. FW300-N1A1]|uniref:RHS repeat-associated core domain-containing protein n=1 Tax=Pseudomonas sp. FW300-N1A1 TaxID=2075555 RepID=UPI000CCFF830|nr:RHS repeat-associated core domain-containing protein [Pseudomonas sp. FW300-N1A1]POA19173.1 hypothetical protein C1886_13875 [Pseudomonas sp. FW300-N1A1]
MPSPQHTLLCSYRYDPLDRLISHTQSHMQTRQRFYCKSRLATEIQGAIGHSIFQHDNLLLAQQQRQDDALDTTLLATDLQRSVLHTLKHNHQRQPIAYCPYGHRCAESGLTSLLGFNGERPDPVTGHYLLGNGYRAFNPVLMRFNSPDSWSPFGNGGVNSYSYCLGDPINKYDPSARVSARIVTGVSKWLNRARRTLQTNNTSNAIQNYISGPETIFETYKKTINHTVQKQWRTMESNGEQWRIATKDDIDYKLNRNGELWHTETTLHNNQDDELYHNFAVSNGDFIERQTMTPGLNIHSFTRTTPILQELAYKKIPGQQLQDLYNNLSLPKIDIKFEKKIFINAEINSKYNNIGTQTNGLHPARYNKFLRRFSPTTYNHFERSARKIRTTI